MTPFAIPYLVRKFKKDWLIYCLLFNGPVENNSYIFRIETGSTKEMKYRNNGAMLQPRQRLLTATGKV
jgi:hypothetical protein